MTTILEKRGLEIISEKTGDSPKQVQRYIKMADQVFLSAPVLNREEHD